MLRAAMAATLATPRTVAAESAAKTMVDAAMANALSKSFESLLAGDKRAHAHGFSVDL